MNQGELAFCCSFLALDDTYFNSKCLSDGKTLLSETLSSKRHGQVSFDKRWYQDEILVSFTAKYRKITIAINTGKQISSLLSSKRKVFDTELHSSVGVTYRKFFDFVMKLRALKSKDDCSCWSSEKRLKEFSKINDSVMSSLQNWMISHLHVMQYLIANDYITVKFVDGIRWVNT